MNRPPSSGQVFGIGSLVASGFFILTRWHAPLLTFFGASDIASFNRGKAFQGLLLIQVFFYRQKEERQLRRLLPSPKCQASIIMY